MGARRVLSRTNFLDFSRDKDKGPKLVLLERPSRAATGRRGVVLALLSVYILWGSTYLAVRIGLNGFPPFLLAAIRFLSAGTLLYGFLRLRGIPAPTRAQWGCSLIVGGLLLGGGNGGVVFSEQWVGSGLAALSVATVPLWAALFAGIWGQWPTRREGLGLMLGFAGIVLLNLDGGLRASPLGAAALIIAAVSWAFGSVWSRRLTLPDGLMASASEMLCGGAVLLLMGLAHREAFHQMPGAGALLAMIYLIFAGVVGFSAYIYLLEHVRPALATSYAYVNPVIAIALGIALAGEKITVAGIAALFLIIASVLLVVFARNRADTEGLTPTS